METINNIASAAAKAVWGENKEEPVSGKTGNVAAGEPYDAGNMEPRESTGVTGSDKVKPTELGSNFGLGREQQHTTSHHEHGAHSGVTGPEELIESSKPTRETTGYDNETSGIPESSSTHHSSTPGLSSGVTGSERVIEETQPTRETSGYDNSNFTTSEAALRPKKAVSSVDNPSYDDNTTRHESSSHRDTTSDNTGLSETAPHKTQDSSVSNRDMSKAQQDVRDPSDPGTDPKTSAIRSNVDDTSGGLDKGDNPDKISGPGPRLVAEVARDHGGDAGLAKPDENRGSSAKEGESDDGPQKTSHGEGTGEKHVKTTGLAADGGDFDATKPGAGAEADRLLETKGVHREAPSTKGAAGGEAATDEHAHAHAHAGEHKEKKSLGEKIKDKLHRHGH